MKDWKDIIYEDEWNELYEKSAEDYYSDLFHIDHRTEDKVQRIPINFNT